MRDTPEKIAGLMLTSSTGAKIPLSQVAEVKLSVGESTITREMNRRHLTVKLNLRGRDLASFLKEAQNVIDAKVDYDKSKYTVKWEGFRKPTQGLYPSFCHSSVDVDVYVYFALCYVWEIPASWSGIVHRAVGALWRNACAQCTRYDIECIVCRGLYCHVRTFHSKRNYYGISDKQFA